MGRKTLLHKSMAWRILFYVVLALIVTSTISLPVFLRADYGAYAEEGGGDGSGGGDTGGGDTGGGDTGGGDGGGGTDPPPISTPKIIDVGIFFKDTGTALGYSTNSSGDIRATISAKGGNIEFDSVVVWTDWSQNRNHFLVSWSVDNDAIATISPNGVLTARSDGVVKVMATVPGSDTDTGLDRVAYTYIKIEGQSNGRYVTSIDIADESGNKLGSIFIWEPDLSIDMKQFHAIVTVKDPLTGDTQTYSTLNGSISSQAPDISDVIWYVGDPDMGAIDDSTGLFRPRVYGGVTVYVYSNAGMSGKKIHNSILVRSKGTQVDGYFPQSSITIKIYYQDYKPEDHGDEAYVISKTYSVADMEALGTVTQTYTAIGGSGFGGYITMTGRGPSFAALLADAGVNLGKVTSFIFDSVDGKWPISESAIFGTKYYYPNIDVNSPAGAVQVYPIIALESNSRVGSTDPDYNMLISTRFRLLFGANWGTSNSQLQRNWIHTIYVIYEGGPSAGYGDGTGGDGSGDGSGGDGEGDGEGDGSGEGSGDEGGQGEKGGAEGNSGNDSKKIGLNIVEGELGAGDTIVSNIGDTSLITQEINEAKTPQASNTDNSRRNSQKFTVYQIMSKYDNENEAVLDFGNPIKPFVAPIGIAVFSIGCIKMLIWYRRQTRKASFAV